MNRQVKDCKYFLFTIVLCIFYSCSNEVHQKKIYGEWYNELFDLSVTVNDNNTATFIGNTIETYPFDLKDNMIIFEIPKLENRVFQRDTKLISNYSTFEDTIKVLLEIGDEIEFVRK